MIAEVSRVEREIIVTISEDEEGGAKNNMRSSF